MNINSISELRNYSKQRRSRLPIYLSRLANGRYGDGH